MMATSFLYAIPYIIVLIILFFLYLKERAGYGYASQIAFLLVLFFIGLRGHLYTDYISYYPFYENLPTVFDLHSYLDTVTFEKGFVIYSSIIKTIFPNYFIWVFINSLIDLSILYLFFKKYSASTVLSFIVFIAFSGLAIEFNLYRNSKAIMLFLLSIPYLKERKIVPYMCINLVAAFFHISAIIYFPLYFILTKEFPRVLIWTIFLVVNIVVIFHLSISNYILSLGEALLGDSVSYAKMLLYSNSGNAYGLTFGFLERTFAFLLFTLYYDKLCEQDEMNRIFYNCFVLYYTLFHLFLDIQVFTERIPLLFVFSYWILYPNVIKSFKIKNNALVVMACLTVLCFYKTISSNNNILTKYDNVLFGIETFEQRQYYFNRYNNLI